MNDDRIMKRRPALRTMLAAAALSAGSAAIGAVTGVLFTRRADDRVSERVCRGYAAMAEAFWTMPDPDLPPPRRARLALVKGGEQG